MPLRNVSCGTRRSRRFSPALLAALLLAAPLGAQESDEGELISPEQSSNEQQREYTYDNLITVTATGLEQRVEDLPLPITILTREQIESSGEESVVDLLRRVPGLTVMRFGDEGASTSIFVRGTESDHVLALFDGVRLNSPYFAGFDWSQLVTAGIERIEVTRGPYSALWGSDAVGGVIHLIPMRNREGSSTRLLAEGGENQWRRLEGSFGWGDDAWDVHTSLFGRDGRGELDNSDFEHRQILLDAGYGGSDTERLSLVYQHLDAEVGIPFSDPLNLTPQRRQDSRQRLLALPMHFQPAPAWRLELTPSLVERQLEFRDPDDPFGFTRSDTFDDTTQIRFASHHAVAVHDHDHSLSWGGEWREDRVDASSNFGVDLDGQRVELIGAFVQDVWQASERFTVVAGLRLDETSEWGSEVSPRLSAGFQANDRVELRVSYGQAFRQPSIGELYFPFSGNPSLEPERSDSAEIGLVLRLGRHRIDAGVFATDSENLIDFQFVDYTFANIERAEIRGTEVAWTYELSSALRSSLQATWLDTSDQDGLALLRRPEWSSSWVFDAHLAKRLRANLALVLVGDRIDVDALTFERKELPSHATADLGLSFSLTEKLDLSLRTLNLADRIYQEVDGYPAPGRRFIAGLRWSL